jgi:hypothetical protein
MQQGSKFGIYVNAKESKVVRINSPYWIPEEPDWVYLTPEVNATLLRIREMAQEQKLASNPGELVWGRIPVED